PRHCPRDDRIALRASPASGPASLDPVHSRHAGPLCEARMGAEPIPRAADAQGQSGRVSMSLRPDLAIIAANVQPVTRVLDVGCGDGALMAALRDQRGCDARGLELDPGDVSAAMARGLSVVQGDADTDLADYPDASFDY